MTTKVTPAAAGVAYLFRNPWAANADVSADVDGDDVDDAGSAVAVWTMTAMKRSVDGGSHFAGCAGI